MSTKTEERRKNILDAANSLVYTKGYNQTSIADVATQVGITKGNLHYHYKSKEELLSAVVELRLQEIRETLASWDEAFPQPTERLKRFVQMLLNEKNELVRYGCPMGTLNMELGKSQTSLREQSRRMFDAFLVWLETQFSLLKKNNPSGLARHFLSMAQGAALMSYVYEDPSWLSDEIDSLFEWLEEI